MHCLYPHPQSDVFQLNVPKNELDIDRQPDPVTDIQSPIALHTASTTQQSPNAENVKEDTAPDTTIQNNIQPLPWIPIGLSLSPHQFHIILTIQDIKTPNN